MVLIFIPLFSLCLCVSVVYFLLIKEPVCFVSLFS